MSALSEAPSTGGGEPAQARRLRAQGRRTLSRLLEAAITVLDQRGYHAARVDDIVKLADTSHGTFYLYFSSKEDLFRALVADVTQEMRRLADELPPINSKRQGYEELREWLGRFYDLYRHYHPVIRAWTESNSQSAELAREGALVLRRFIHQLVRRVKEIEPAPVGDPEVAALAMVSMVERASFYSVVGLVAADREALVDVLAGILHVGLFGGRRPPPVLEAQQLVPAVVPEPGRQVRPVRPGHGPVSVGPRGCHHTGPGSSQRSRIRSTGPTAKFSPSTRSQSAVRPTSGSAPSMTRAASTPSSTSWARTTSWWSATTRTPTPPGRPPRPRPSRAA